jgi:hypothetical protein
MCLDAASSRAAMFTFGERYVASTLSREPTAPSIAHPMCSPKPMFTQKPGCAACTRQALPLCRRGIEQWSRRCLPIAAPSGAVSTRRFIPGGMASHEALVIPSDPIIARGVGGVVPAAPCCRCIASACSSWTPTRGTGCAREPCPHGSGSSAEGLGCLASIEVRTKLRSAASAISSSPSYSLPTCANPSVASIVLGGFCPMLRSLAALAGGRVCARGCACECVWARAVWPAA